MELYRTTGFPHLMQEEHKEEMKKLEHKLTLLEMPTKSLPTDIKPNISGP